MGEGVDLYVRSVSIELIYYRLSAFVRFLSLGKLSDEERIHLCSRKRMMVMERRFFGIL